MSSQVGGLEVQHLTSRTIVEGFVEEEVAVIAERLRASRAHIKGSLSDDMKPVHVLLARGTLLNPGSFR